MSELDVLFGQRDAALFREDMERVAALEAKIAKLTVALRRELDRDLGAMLGAALASFEKELREQR